MQPQHFYIRLSNPTARNPNGSVEEGWYVIKKGFCSSRTLPASRCRVRGASSGWSEGTIQGLSRWRSSNSTRRIGVHACARTTLPGLGCFLLRYRPFALPRTCFRLG
jgi:hypothetical protein